VVSGCCLCYGVLREQTASGSLLHSLSSLPSSLADDLDASSACTSPLRLSGPATNSSGCSPWQRSSANGPVLVSRNSCDSGHAEHQLATDRLFQRQQRSLGAAAGWGADAATAAASMVAAAGMSFQAVNARRLEEAGSSDALASNAIEVLQMPSGSFTRVKLAAHSAPSAPAGCDSDSLSSTSLLQPRFAVSCLFREEQGSSLANPAAVAAGMRFYNGADCIRRSHSVGTAAPAITSRPSGAHTRYASRTSNVGDGFRPAFAGFAAAAAMGQDTTTSSSSSSSSYTDFHRKSSASNSFQLKPKASGVGPLLAGPPSCAAGDLSSPMGSAAAMELGYREPGLDAVSAAMATAAALLPNIKRQRSTPLPPLAESPGVSPGSSPAIGPSYVASYSHYLSQCNGQVTGDGNQTTQQGDRSSGSSAEPLDILHPGSFSQYPAGAATAASTGSSSVPVSPEHSITGLVQSDDGVYDCPASSRHPFGLGMHLDPLEASIAAVDGSDEALLLEPRGTHSFEFSRLMR